MTIALRPSFVLRSAAGFAGLAILSSPSASAAQALAPPAGAELWLVSVAHDSAAHAAALSELGELRRVRALSAFEARVAALQAEQAARRAPLAAWIEARGADVLSAVTLTDTLIVSDPGGAVIAALGAHPLVRELERDALRRPQTAQAIDASHHDAVGAHALSVGGVPIKGAGVVIAIIDSGLDTDMNGTGRPHAAFYPGGNPATPTGPGIAGSRVLSQQHFGFDYQSALEDVHGHGTRMGAMAGGAKWNGLANVSDGVAPAALLRSLKISDDVFGAAASTVAQASAFDAAVLHGDVLVANMSYDGDSAVGSFLNEAIDDAVLAGVFVSLSGGNYGADLTWAHACYNAVAAGGALETSPQPADLPGLTISAIGPLPDGRRYPHLLGQGADLTTAKLDDEAGALVSFGTSGGSALISGAASLVRQADPQATALETRALLLNSAQAVTAGDPDAAGWGYLKVKAAVQDALAGLVRTETVALGEIRSFHRGLAAGEEASFTLAWNRELPETDFIDDLDLRVRDPEGALIAWSASQVDDVEQIRFTAAAGGVYELEVVPITFALDAEATFALAGVDTPSVQGSCSGSAAITGFSPAAVPNLVAGPSNEVLITGCGFTGTNLILWGSTALVAGFTFAVIDDNAILANAPVDQPLGPTAVTVLTPSGAASATVGVVAPPPTLKNLHKNVGLGIQQIQNKLGGTPGDYFVWIASPDLIPTDVPGIAHLDIGNGGTTLLPLAWGFLPADGVVDVQVAVPPGALPIGDYVHLQAVLVRAPLYPLPAEETNTSNVLVVI